MNDDSEKPKINPFKYNKNILNGIPIMVSPKVQIIIMYDKLIIILFLNSRILLVVLVFILFIKRVIFSITSF